MNCHVYVVFPYGPWGCCLGTDVFLLVCTKAAINIYISYIVIVYSIVRSRNRMHPSRMNGRTVLTGKIVPKYEIHSGLNYMCCQDFSVVVVKIAFISMPPRIVW
jgi:hypothetical protein